MINYTKPAIVEAARARNILDAALMYLQHGLSVIPCVGKRAALNAWADFQNRHASRYLVQEWHRTGRLQNVAIICGQISGGLVVIDLDGDDAVDHFYSVFPKYRHTYTVLSGSGHGRHLYFKVDLPISTTRTVTDLGGFELRSDGAYIIAPPSTHPSGGRYYVVNDTAPMRLDSMQNVRQWILSLMREKHGGKLPDPTPWPPAAPHSNSVYGAAAMRDEANKVRMALPGQRNEQLNRSAFKLGKLVAKGCLTRSEVESGLYAAAMMLTATDGEAATLKTIKSGLDAGISS